MEPGKRRERKRGQEENICRNRKDERVRGKRRRYRQDE